MDNFKNALIAFLNGQLDAAGVQATLTEGVRRNPALAQPYITQLNHLYKNRRLTPQVYSQFRSAVVAARDGGETLVTAPPAANAPGPVVPPQEAPPKSSDTPSDTPPDAPDEEDAGKTRFKMPPGHDTAGGEPDKPDATQFRPPPPGPGTTGASQTGTGQTGVSQTGVSQTGAFTAGTSGASSWGSPSSWTQPQAGPIGVGSIIKGRFVIEELLGKGGMGMVFKARDLRKEEAQDRKPYVALKILNEEFKQHPDSLKALQRESVKAQQLAHPNIVNVFDFDRDAGTVFMTMELLEGAPLDEFIKKHQNVGISWQEAFPIIKGMSLALDYAHRKGIIHSDFKPGNCYLTEDGTVKVFDFGIARAAKFAGDIAGEETKFDAATLGALTPAYASVEMIEGDEPDKRDDVYALACTAYELLTGRHPFEKRSAAEAKRKKLVPPLIKGLPKWRYRALIKGLAFDRADRSESAFGFLSALNPKRSRRLLAVGGGVAAVVAVLVVALVVVPNYLYERKIKQISAGLVAGNYEQLRASLARMSDLEELNRRDLLGKHRETITATFEQHSASLFNLDSENYRYPEARAVLDQVIALYPDSSQVKELDDGLETAKSSLLAELARQYDEFLESGALLDGPGDDIEDVRQTLAQIQPDDNLLNDPRLPLALGAKARQAADAEDFATAEAYVTAGMRLAPDDAEFINLRDRIGSERAAKERVQRISDLETRLAERAPQLKTLDDFAAVRRDFRDLKQLQADNPVVARIGAALRAELDVQLQRQIDARQWLDARDRLNEFSDVLEQSYLERGAERVAQAQRSHDEAIAALASRLDEKLANTNPRTLDAAGVDKLIENLQTSGASPDAVVDARARAAAAYLTSATNARAEQDWELARVWANRGLQLQSTGDVSQELRAELARIDSQEDVAGQELLDRERQGLVAQFDARLAQTRFAIGDVRAALRVVKDLEDERFADAAQTQTFLAAAPERIATRAARAADTLGEQGRWDDAFALLSAADKALGSSPTLAQARERLGSERQETLNAAQSAQIERHRDALSTLLAKPELDDAWDDALNAQLDALSKLNPTDTVIGRTREEVANAYLNRARELRGQERWSRARQDLAKATTFAPNLVAVVSETNILDAAEENYQAQQSQQLQAAQINAARDRFKREVDARALDRAERELAQLKNLLPAGDPFITNDAPRLLADGYQRSAAELATRDQFSNAIRALDAGLGHVPSDTALLAAKDTYNKQRDVYNAIQSKRADEMRGVAATLDALKSVVPDYSGFEQRRRADAQRVIRDQARSDRQLARALLDAAQLPFPGLDVNIPRDPPPVTAAIAEPSVTTPPAVVSEPTPQPVVRTPPPRTSRSADPCADKRPGSGSRCSDKLSDDANGPSLVVVPGVGGGAPFAISRYEINIRQFNKYCEQTGACASLPGSSRLPATNVSAAQMEAYAAWLSAETGAQYSLPTQAEWRHAASAGGERPNRQVNCFRRNTSGQQEAGFSLMRVDSNKDNANGWGLINVLGNASELASNGGSYNALGGAYDDSARDCDVSHSKSTSGGPDEKVGFRLVRR